MAFSDVACINILIYYVKIHVEINMRCVSVIVNINQTSSPFLQITNNRMLRPQFSVQKLYLVVGGPLTSIFCPSIITCVNHAPIHIMGTSLIRSRVLDEPIINREQQTLRDTGRQRRCMSKTHLRSHQCEY